MNRNLFAITLACLSCIVLLPTVKAEENSSKKAESKPFAWWCQNYDSFPEETQITIKAVITSEEVGSVNNCQLADSKLRQTKKLTIHNGLGRRIIQDLKPISTLNHLTVLYISGGVSDLSPLASMTKLEKLEIVGGGNISDLRPLAQMKNMSRLSLSGNRIVDITTLSRMVKLWDLNLSGNTISDVKPLSKLVNLTHLDLSKNQVSDIRSLSTLKKVYSFSLYDNKFTEANCPLKSNICRF
jgi:internalin A